MSVQWGGYVHPSASFIFNTTQQIFMEFGVGKLYQKLSKEFECLSMVHNNSV
jgi:hypothetical protein